MSARGAKKGTRRGVTVRSYALTGVRCEVLHRIKMTPKQRRALTAHLRIKLAADRETKQERHDDVLLPERLHSSVSPVTMNFEHFRPVKLLHDT